MLRHLRFTVRVLVIIVAMAACGVPIAAVSTQGKGGDTLLEIDGSKTPEQIPDWAPWESAFRTLKAQRGQPGSTRWSALQLSAEDDALLAAEVDAVDELATRTGEALRARTIAMKAAGADPGDILAEDRAGQIEYRWKLLDTVERLRLKLSRQAFAALADSVEQARHGMKVSVSKSDLEHFKKPR